MRLTSPIVAAVLVLGFFLGITPTVEAAPPNDFFATEATFPGVSWTDISGSSLTNVMAVGAGGGVARAAHYNGAWATADPTAGTVMRQVSAIDATHVYASGNAGAGASTNFQTWNGATWTASATALSAETFGLWAQPATNNVEMGVITVAPPTTTMVPEEHFGGVSWSACSLSCLSPPLPRVRAMYGFSSSDIWMVGQLQDTGSGQMLPGAGHFATPGVWTAFTLPSTTSISAFDVWGFSTNDVWAVGQNGNIWHWNGATWLSVASGTTRTLRGIWGTSANDIWAVGASGTYIRWDGATWSPQPSTTTEDVMGVWCFNVSSCWSATASGTIQRLQIVASVGPPVLAIATVHSELFKLTVSDAPQCIGDRGTFSMVLDLPSALVTLNDGDVWVYSYETGFWVLDLDDAIWNPTIPAGVTAQFAAVDYLLPPGRYVALAIVDLAGVGAVDHYDGESFTVGRDPCTDTDAVDISQVLSNLTRMETRLNTTCQKTTNTDCEGIKARVNSTFLDEKSQLNRMETRLNTTCQKSTGSTTTDCEGMKVFNLFQAFQTNAIINLTFGNLDNHFHQTDSYINASRDTIVNLLQNLNTTCANCTLNNTDVLEVLGNLDSSIGHSLALFFWLALLCVGFFLVFQTSWSVPKFIAIVLFLLSIYVGMAELGSPFGPIALACGVLGMALASAKESKTGTD